MGILAKASIMLQSAVLTLTASPALAAVGGPQIAYTVASGQAQSIYLANPDGSGTVKVYTGASKANVVQIDIRPGGNQMAIIEQSSTSQGALKIINYSDAGVRQTVTAASNPGCYILGVDYHPSDGSLIASRYCNSAAIQEVRRYDPASNVWAGDPLVQVTDGNPNKSAGKVRWIGDGSGFLWVVSDTTVGGRIERHNLSNTYAPVTVYSTGTASQPNFFDVARCNAAQTCNELVVTSQNGEIHRVTFDDFGGTDRGSLFSSASDGHYSPDNAHVLWRQQLRRGYQLEIDNQTYVTASGAKDWRQ